MNNIQHTQLLKADRDPRRAARSAHLTYVDLNLPGIQRKNQKNGYSYIYGGKKVRKIEELERIRRLAIPPSWKNVWICPNPTGHIQATGIDMNGRKQYRYHSEWNEIRKETKFHRLYEFGKQLPRLRRNMRRDLKGRELSADKVLAAVIGLMERTYIRVGNFDYEKTYGSYGLTTMKDKHVTIVRDNIQFSFVGKKGIAHRISLKNKKLAHIVKECRDLPGKELFQYYDEKGQKKKIDSGMLNEYIKKHSGSDFTAKDFRTWAGSLQALQFLCATGSCDNSRMAKKNILEMLDHVSARLGNSRSICKKYYIHPSIISLYEENKLGSLQDQNKAHHTPLPKGLSIAETSLLAILKN